MISRSLFVHFIVCFLLFIACFGVFFNSLDNEFVFDDHLAIVNNVDTDPSTPFSDLWKHDIWGKDLMAHDSHRSYRPLLIITFRIIRYFYGLDARYIRIASILSHSISSILVYILGLQILGNWHVSFGSAILFALHPVHVEVRIFIKFCDVNKLSLTVCLYYVYAIIYSLLQQWLILRSRYHVYFIALHC